MIADIKKEIGQQIDYLERTITRLRKQLADLVLDGGSCEDLRTRVNKLDFQETTRNRWMRLLDDHCGSVDDIKEFMAGARDPFAHSMAEVLTPILEPVSTQWPREISTTGE